MDVVPAMAVAFGGEDPAPIRRLAANPFRVLGLQAHATPAAIAARAQVLRTGSEGSECIHAAERALSDPDERLLHEVWARQPARDVDPDRGWAHAAAAFGWGKSCLKH